MEGEGNPLKYFAHGIVWSISFLLLSIAWAFILVVLVFAGLFIGLILGFAVLFIFMGALNFTITRAIWDVDVDSDWKGDFGHGFILFIALLVAGIPNLVISAMSPGLITAIVLFFVYCFVDGYIAKQVAMGWENGERPEYAGETEEKGGGNFDNPSRTGDRQPKT